MTALPIMLDVDTGIDDAIAIGMASQVDDCELVAVSTVSGNTSVINATKNSRDVLHMFGRQDVPVHRGASRPLSRPHISAEHVHAGNGLGGVELPMGLQPEGADRGPAAMIRLARSRPGELTVVCVGPLTNLAIALNVEPTLPSLLKRVVVMGGAFRVPGNFTRSAEFNFYCDPEAAQQVFATEFPEIIAVGLDVTRTVALSRRAWESSAEADSIPGKFIYTMLERFFAQPEPTGRFVHDAVALAIALDPSLVSFDTSHIQVLAGNDERGSSRMVAHADVQVAINLDGDRFLDQLYGVYGLTDESGIDAVVRAMD